MHELDFVRQPMVAWFSPTELVKAGIEAAVSAVFGSYADKREVESVLAEAEWHDYTKVFAEKDELWLDYIADLGDGFDATYTMAELLSEEDLPFRIDHEDHRTERGRILIMGGDEVYPTASREEYQNRMIGPYQAALPWVSPDRTPDLYLIPGNHDWYDGLTNFYRLFCQHRWVGGRRTRQRRSYFALKLTDTLWLWGTDIQLNSDIDQPQFDYFDAIASDPKVMMPGSKVILCTAEPSWVYAETRTGEVTDPREREKEKEKVYNNVGYIERNAIQANGHELVVGLAGDWHNYTRYEEVDGGHQRFVSGGGGAYLYPTHNMPEKLALPKRFGGEKYERKAIFPEEDDSRRMARRSFFFAFFRLNWGFTAFLGGVYLLIAWIMQSVSKISSAPGKSLVEVLGTEGFSLAKYLAVVAHSPGCVVFLALMVFGLVGFTDRKKFSAKLAIGGTHGLMHVALLLVLIWFFASLNLSWGASVFAVAFSWLNPLVEWVGLNPAWGVNHPGQALLFALEMFFLGGFMGGMVMGLYLWAANRFFRIHDNEVLLCQSIPDFKHFLRLHIRPGGITIYPIGVDTVCDTWAHRPEAMDGRPWFEPEDKDISSLAHLIEDPISVAL